MNKMSLVEIALDTLKTIENSFYVNNLGREISVRETTDFAVYNTENVCPEDFPLAFNLKRNGDKTFFEVTDEITIEAAKRICRENKSANPFVLNFANGFQPVFNYAEV